jgi:hypothetical protein
MPILFFILFIFGMYSCQETPIMGNVPDPTPNPRVIQDLPTAGDFKGTNILFVGNSLTYTNDLPKVVRQIAALDSQNLSYTSLCFPNYSFEDHLQDGELQKQIKSNRYQFIVGQQGPSALPESQIILLRDTRVITDLLIDTKTKLALYTVWPSRARFFDLDQVIYSYSQASKEYKAISCPAGLAWKNAWAIKPEFPFYSADQFHPSPLGTFVAALTIYAALEKKKSLEFIPADMAYQWSQLESEDWAIIKNAILKAIKE